MSTRIRACALGRRLTARLAGEAGFTLAEMLVVVVIIGVIGTVISHSFIASAKMTSAITTRLDESHDAQTLAARFVTDVQNASYFSATTPPSGTTCPTSDLSPVALLEWTDGGVTRDAFYGVKGSPAQLVRRYCESTGHQSDLNVVDHLKATPTVTCPPPELTAPACGSTTPAVVQIDVTEASGYSYSLRAAPRVGGAGGAMPGIAVYIGGDGLLLSGNSTLQADSGTVVVGGLGNSTCNGTDSKVAAPDGFFAAQPGGCSATVGTAPADPLWALPAPATPPAAPAPAASNLCGVANQTTYQPGYYAGATDFTGCLASGVYYLAQGGSMSNVASAPGGVLIYVEQQSGKSFSLENSIALSPMTTGSQSGVTIFMARSLNQEIEIRNTMTVNGIMYAPAGTLLLQANNANLTTGGINVNRFEIKGNGSGVIVN